MSYSSDIKGALSKLKTDDFDLDFSELYGMIFGGASFVFRGMGKWGIRITSTIASVEYRLYTLLKNQYGIQAEVIQTQNSNFGKTREYQITIDDPQIVAMILRNYGMMDDSGNLISLRIIDKDLMHNESEYHAFLRGVLLTCASINDPAKSFSVEFHFTDNIAAVQFSDFLRDLEIDSKIRENKNSYVVYVRRSSDVSSLLFMCGATRYGLAVEERSTVKAMKERMNREHNFDMANFNRSLDAAQQQIDAIEKIINMRGMSYLSDDLIKTANLRLDNPDISLEELSQIAGMSKSTLYKRLRKIMDISKGL